MTNPRKQPKRELVITCRIAGVEVTLEELAAEVVRCGGLVRKGQK